ncbi:unnamed protein product [Chondrus crispus]|uniref:Uncharacterized protein n=1 Tax=Chondrus crispus TaxID=2769 RepID=R7QCB4_CHOCR|nr:unnamed protein product [Chondrus crispus]CDF35046.1 unnamed protein product [Chondrus crispus]|eukprot:XP_005714865.1 unnamed protein product [Chondrus crispus]
MHSRIYDALDVAPDSAAAQGRRDQRAVARQPLPPTATARAAQRGETGEAVQAVGGSGGVRAALICTRTLQSFLSTFSLPAGLMSMLSST